MTVPDPPGPQRLLRLLDGYLTTQLVYLAVRLGIADALAGGPRTAAELAAAAGVPAGRLVRVLRGLAAEEVLDELPDGRFALTATGDCLRSDAPGSMGGAALVRGELYGAAAGGLLTALRTGGTAFEQVHGQRFFPYLEAHPEQQATFAASMAGRSDREAADIVAAYDFGGIGHLVDVGGGLGVLVTAILRATPGLTATLVDRPALVGPARDRIAAAGLADRCTVVGGDFFAEVPGGAEAYVLSRILHDWDDDEAGAILATCRKAVPPGGRLLVAEALLPGRARDQPAAIRMDLTMLTLFGAARERTEAEYRALLAGAGFPVTAVIPTASPVGLGLIEARG
jgi:predicted O-methyltransferase YrrM